MQKIICKKVYDTQNSRLIKKISFGNFGSPNGYEESLYQTENGLFFLYTNGGAESKYPNENITRMSVEKKNAWLKANE